MKLFTVAVATFLTASGAFAQSADRLSDLRDTLAAGPCPDLGPAQAHQVAQGTLHQMRCRNLAMEILDVFALETPDGVRVLQFPTINLRPGTSLAGTADWAKTQMLGILTVPSIPSPVVMAEANVLRSGHRIAPGVGTGHLVSTYRLEESGPVLESVILAEDDGTLRAIWPKPRVASDPRTVADNLDGFGVLDAARFDSGSLFDILAQVQTDFPGLGEEGQPGLEIDTTRHGTSLAVEVRETGWADDSVSGRATRLLLAQAGDGWSVTQAGTAWICARGDVRLSAGPCP